MTARLVEAQLADDGTYPNAAAVFAEGVEARVEDARAFDVSVAPLNPSAHEGGSSGEEEPRDWHGRWTTGAGRGGSPTASLTPAALHPDERRRRRAERKRERVRRREREGEATNNPGDPDKREEPRHPKSPGRKPAGSARRSPNLSAVGVEQPVSFAFG